MEKIDVKSKVGVGSVFTVTLPLVIQSKPTRNGKLDERLALIVEDDEDLASIYFCEEPFGG